MSSLEEKGELLPQGGDRRKRSRGFHLGKALLLCGICSVLLWRSHTKPKSLDQQALELLTDYPLIDGHIDLPIMYRALAGNQLDRIDLRKTNATTDVDIPRLHKGRLGGAFWSAFVGCPTDKADTNFTTASWRVRDTLEQIDISKLIIDQYDDIFELVDTAAQARRAFKRGKIASFIGVEGGHQLGNSISTLRSYRQLGVRYVTLTHVCNNAFADSSFLPGIHGGLSQLGSDLVREMNRIGMLVDISHTSDQTAIMALQQSEAPIIWSHSGARAVNDHVRNVPDDVLEHVKTSKAGDALIMVNFVPYFVSNQSDIPISIVANHIDHIASIIGRQRIGIGSDFDGMYPDQNRVHGLEDVSGYPNLIVELLRRQWSKKDIIGLMGENLLRILDKADAVAHHLQKQRMRPITTLYDRRPDLPMRF